MAKAVANHSARSPFRNLHFYFALLIPATVLGFGKSMSDGVTFSGRSLTPIVLVHAALMALWMLMLVAQAWFIRTKRLSLHRLVGRSSYALMPIIMVGILVAEHELLNHSSEGISAQDARLEVFGIPQILAFAVPWALAIIYRKRTPMHVRFMISTAFGMSTAITFRIILNWFTWLPGLDPNSLDGIAAANWIVLTLPLLGLIAMDRRMGVNRSPFWIVTVLIGIMHVGYWTYGKTEAWFAFVQWFADLPLRAS